MYFGALEVKLPTDLKFDGDVIGKASVQWSIEMYLRHELTYSNVHQVMTDLKWNVCVGVFIRK